jgi:outer membrane protein assembly factor BamC
MFVPVRTMKLALLGFLVAALAGCGTGSGFNNVVLGKKVDYKAATTEPSLEVPPDLTKPSQDDAMAIPDVTPSGTATYSDYSSERRTTTAQSAGDSSVLPDLRDVQVQRDGDKYWLVVKGEPAQVWPKVRDFWLKNGFLLTTDDPSIGIMETDWAENRADIPQGPIRSLLSKVIPSVYSAATRDKFHVRLEHGEQPGSTEVYLTHRGMEEVVQGDETTMWQPRPEDPELEVTMLKHLMMSLGVQEQRAQQELAQAQTQPARARLVEAADGEPLLELDESFSRAWRVTGLALDRVGFNVQDRDRARGVYYVRYDDPDKRKSEGFLSKLAFWKSDEKKPEDLYQVHLKPDGTKTQIVVLGKDGQKDTKGTGKRILTLLQEQLK